MIFFVFLTMKTPVERGESRIQGGISKPEERKKQATQKVIQNKFLFRSKPGPACRQFFYLI
jgi:hypothetical protein